jgi:hypothetical protein
MRTNIYPYDPPQPGSAPFAPVQTPPPVPVQNPVQPYQK